MFDFLTISTRSKKTGVTEIYPKFKIIPSSDLMIRGGNFYAIWDEERGLWTTNEFDAYRLIDKELDEYKKQHESDIEGVTKVLHIWDSGSGMIDAWHKYCQRQQIDTFKMLDEKLIFSNSPTNKKDYASKRLNYPLEPGPCPAWEKLISTLYSPEERHKIEWAIGSIVSGESKTLQKFLVLYGAAGTGKSTILNIIQQLFEGYYTVFDAKALGSSNNSFALESFTSNPLVAIQHDGDLSKIEDNTRLNSLVSHELMTVNEKFKSAYTNRFKCFLFMGTNKPVKITDGKSGLLRRLIDVHPSGNKLNPKEYRYVTKQISFELGAIASHCKDVFLKNPGAYDDYIPISMMGASNDFYNFVIDSYHIFLKDDGTTLKSAWAMYKEYCEEAKVPYVISKMKFKEELKNYFREFKERVVAEDGSRLSSYYSGFRTNIFDNDTPEREEPKSQLIEFDSSESIFDKECSDCLAQYASSNETPSKKWENVSTKLSSLDTSKLHYVKVPENHIVIDFDIKNEKGEKSYDLNLRAASTWPPTYAELSKSGNGIHLHYIYSGDVSRLSRVYDDYIEIKVFSGKSSLRRKLTKCNSLPIATINSGLPLKEDAKLINKDVVQTEKGLRTTIKKCLNKEVHPNTKSNIDFINDILNKAYESGLVYDVSDMKNDVVGFAANSTNQASYCIKLANKMKFQSEESSTNSDNVDTPIVFYDIEVFPNLFLVNWKQQGDGNPVVRMINPSQSEIEELVTKKLVGFNCRRYDNHILYGRLIGYTNEQLYDLSQRIIGNDKRAFFREAYNISYTDIYDFASAGNKKSLKKLEIEMGIHHQELGLPWDKPVPEDKWLEVAEYCDNDVIATEAAFNYLSADWTARQILADLAGMTVNDTTNSLTTKIIFGNNRKPQNEFCYRDLSKPVLELDSDVKDFLTEACPEMMREPHGDAKSLLPYFPGYKYEAGVSTYRGEEVGEGGYVYAEPGMYGNIALLDVSSMHPHSTIAECLFGPRFTRAFRDIVEGRVSIKHEDWDVVNTMLEGKLTPYIQKVIDGEMTSKQLADALKTAINSVYGLTAASFDNAFRDPRNIDNIVAKRGALFMIDLKHAVQEQGFTVVHIKTDSIKIADATPEIIDFVMRFGERYGYSFEHEATYDRICLVNDAVYIAKYKDGKHAGEWTATGTQFQIPYVFKKLFSQEPIEFSDMCETKSVSTALYLDMNESLPDVSALEAEKAALWKKINDPNYIQESMNTEYARIEELTSLIDKGHNYQFIGKVGLFTPIKSGCGGGELLREGKDKEGNIKYSSATGAKDYRWLESEMVKTLHKEDDIDRSYYDNLVNDAIEAISKYGDFEWFVSDDPYISNFEHPISNDDLPWTHSGTPWEETTPFDVR